LDSLTALETAVYTALVNATFTSDSTTYTWGTNIWVNDVPASVDFPFVFMTLEAGRDTNTNLTSDPLLTYAIRCVHNNQRVAKAGKDKLQTLLDDKGEFDVSSGYLDASANGWTIRTSTAEAHIDLMEYDEKGTTRAYHAGYQFTFRMQEV